MEFNTMIDEVKAHCGVAPEYSIPPDSLDKVVEFMCMKLINQQDEIDFIANELKRIKGELLNSTEC